VQMCTNSPPCASATNTIVEDKLLDIFKAS
jgi:hypothetical protein